MKRLLSVFAIAMFLGGISATGIMELVSYAYAANCVANDNLSEKARTFIGRCRKGSINREFPGEVLDKTLSEIKKGSSSTHTKAWKLLNDSRFAK